MEEDTKKLNLQLKKWSNKEKIEENLINHSMVKDSVNQLREPLLDDLPHPTHSVV